MFTIKIHSRLTTIIKVILRVINLNQWGATQSCRDHHSARFSSYHIAQSVSSRLPVRSENPSGPWFQDWSAHPETKLTAQKIRPRPKYKINKKKKKRTYWAGRRQVNVPGKQRKSKELQSEHLENIRRSQHCLEEESQGRAANKEHRWELMRHSWKMLPNQERAQEEQVPRGRPEIRHRNGTHYSRTTNGSWSGRQGEGGALNLNIGG